MLNEDENVCLLVPAQLKMGSCRGAQCVSTIGHNNYSEVLYITTHAVLL